MSAFHQLIRHHKRLILLKPNDVFTPGKLPIRPNNIYAARGEAEKLFLKALRRAMIPIVYGEYGVGKTSMARYALRDKDAKGLLINIESVADKTLADVFARCLEKLGYSVTTKVTTESNTTNAHEQSASAEAGIHWFKAMIASKRTATDGGSNVTEEQFSVTSPTDSKLIEICEAAGVVLLLDELHRATPEFGADLAKFIKSYGNANCHEFKLVLLGTAADASKLVSSDPGIDRLLQEVNLTSMLEPESTFVVTQGMHALAIEIDPQTSSSLVRTSVGSPSILQYLSLELAEAAFDRHPRKVAADDLQLALKTFVETKEARLYKSYVAAVESVGDYRYRKQILRAMAECESEYVTMEVIRTSVCDYLERDVLSSALSGPLRDLKDDRYGAVLSDVDKPDKDGRLSNYTTFRDPGLKAFIRLLLHRESEEQQAQ
jgi:AAA domain